MATTKTLTKIGPRDVHCPKCNAGISSPCVDVFGPSFREVADHRVRLIAAYRLNNPTSADSAWR